MSRQPYKLFCSFCVATVVCIAGQPFVVAPKLLKCVSVRVASQARFDTLAFVAFPASKPVCSVERALGPRHATYACPPIGRRVPPTVGAFYATTKCLTFVLFIFASLRSRDLNDLVFLITTTNIQFAIVDALTG